MFLFCSWEFGSHADYLSWKYTIYVHCHHEYIYSSFKRFNVVFMLFLFIYWCPTRFQCQIMFLSYWRKTRNVTSWTNISYSPPPWAPEFNHWSLHSSHCSNFSFLCSDLYITVCPFVTSPVAMILSVFCHFTCGLDIVCLLSLTLWPWYFLSFVTSPLVMIVSVFFDVRLLVTSLISSSLSWTLAKLSYACYLCFKVSTNGLYFPTIYACIAY